MELLATAFSRSNTPPIKDLRAFKIAGGNRIMLRGWKPRKFALAGKFFSPAHRRDCINVNSISESDPETRLNFSVHLTVAVHR